MLDALVYEIDAHLLETIDLHVFETEDVLDVLSLYSRCIIAVS